MDNVEQYKMYPLKNIHRTFDICIVPLKQAGTLSFHNELFRIWIKVENNAYLKKNQINNPHIYSTTFYLNNL